MNKILLNFSMVGAVLASIQGASGMDVEVSKKVNRKLYGGSREVYSEIYDGVSVDKKDVLFFHSERAFHEAKKENQLEVAINAIAYANYPPVHINHYASSGGLKAVTINYPIAPINSYAIPKCLQAIPLDYLIVTAQVVSHNTRSLKKQKK